MVCPVCDSDIPERSGAGRTREYCSRECKDLTNYLRAAEAALVLVKEHASPECLLSLRSRLWSMANGLNRKRNGPGGAGLVVTNEGGVGS